MHADTCHHHPHFQRGRKLFLSGRGQHTSSSYPEDCFLTYTVQQAAEATVRITNSVSPPPSWPARATPEGLCQLGQALR